MFCFSKRGMAGKHPIHPLSLTSCLAINGKREIIYPCKKLSFLRKHFPGIRLLSQGFMTYNYNHVPYTNDSRCPVPNGTGGDTSNKCCFGAKPKLFRESGDFPGNRDTWKFSGKHAIIPGYCSNSVC